MLKNFRSLVMLALMAAFATSAVSCGGDDDNTPANTDKPVGVSDYNIASGTAMGYYYGNNMLRSHNLHYIIMLDNAEEPTKQLYMQLLTSTNVKSDGKLPEGRYPLILPNDINKAASNGTLADFVAIAGSSDNNGAPVYCYYTDIEGNICLLKEGTVNVSKTLSTYTISIENAKAILANDPTGPEVTVSAAFTGNIETTDLSRSYNINFPAATKGQLVSFGDYYGEGMGLWQLTLAPEGMAGEGFRIEFLTAGTSADADISGTYVAGRWNDDGSLEAAAGMFIPGSTDENGIYGTYYMQVDADGALKAYDLAVGGKIIIKKSGDEHEVRIEAVDNAATPQTLVGTWKGKLDIQTQQ